MKVKIGDLVIDSSKEPVMLVLDSQDMQNIKHMRKGCTKYAVLPEEWSERQIKSFMDIKIQANQIQSGKVVYSGIQLTVVKGTIKFLKFIRFFLLMHFGITDIIIYNKFMEVLDKVEDILKAKK